MTTLHNPYFWCFRFKIKKIKNTTSPCHSISCINTNINFYRFTDNIIV